MFRMHCGLLAILMVASAPLRAQVPVSAEAGPEIALGVLAHGVRKPFRSAPPDGFSFYEGEEERGTADIQLLYRTAPLANAFQPRLAAKVQLNTSGRTNFASIGAEWRQHMLSGRVYGQAGIGLTLHDGYRFTPDPFAPGLTTQEQARRYDLYLHRTGFGSRLLFNPNLSLGVRINGRLAVEATFEHFSHAAIFSDQNPGINNLGIRLVTRR